MNIPTLPQLPVDKANHFVYGYGIYLVVKFLSRNAQLALIVTVVIAIAKEIIHDKLMKKGTPDIWDAAATIIPAILIYSQDM